MNQHFEWETGSGRANAHGQINKHTNTHLEAAEAAAVTSLLGRQVTNEPQHIVLALEMSRGVKMSPQMAPVHQMSPSQSMPFPSLSSYTFSLCTLFWSCPPPYTFPSLSHSLPVSSFTATIMSFDIFFFSFHFTIKADDNINYELHWELMWCPFFFTLFPSHRREVIFVIWPFPLERLLNTCWRSVFLRQPPRQER